MLSPPSTFLPPLARLQHNDTSQLSTVLQTLERLYWPTRRFHTLSRDIDAIPDSGYASVEGRTAFDSQATWKASERLAHLEVLRADPFERQLAVKWLTGFIARADLLELDEATCAAYVDRAASILSSFVSAEAEEAEVSVTRSFKFNQQDDKVVNVELNDAPLSSSDHTSVGLQSWGSSILLAGRLCQNPRVFFPTACRVLELGAGTGLLSVVASKLGLAVSEVISTDYHPDVLDNLSLNVHTNFTTGDAHIAVHSLDWEHPQWNAPFNTSFQVILAADVIYHVQHAQWIKGCVEHLLDKDGGLFWLVIPVRTTGRHEGMYGTVSDVFNGEGGLVIFEQVELERQRGFGRADEDRYILFKIGWK